MKRFLLFTAVTLFFSTNVFARILPIYDYIKGGEDGKGLFVEFANSYKEVSCKDIYGENAVETKPAGFECDSHQLGSKICYYNCNCPSEWKSCVGNGLVGIGDVCIKNNGDQVYASCTCDFQVYKQCAEPALGLGETCTNDGTVYYSSCKCPDEYDKTCASNSQIGDGEACTDDKGTKYKSCRCNGNYKICEGDEGRGEPCTLDGVNKYESCLYGEVSDICHTVTNATPYDKSPEYILHANAFRGIENTKAIINSQGEAATAAYAAVHYRPNKYIPIDHEYFGSGKWYLPAVGEMLYLSGTDFSKMTGIDDNTQITDETYNKVNNALLTLLNKGGRENFHPFLHPEKRSTTNYTYSAYDHWTSSYGWNTKPYFWAAPTFFNQRTSGVYQNRYSAGWRGYTAGTNKSTRNYWSWYHHVRPVLMLQSCFSNYDIHVGDVVFTDMSVGSADSFNVNDGGNRYPVGVIYWISDDKNLVRIISVKPVSFVGDGYQWIYDPSNPDGDCGDIQNCVSRRVSVVNEKHQRYFYDDVHIAAINKDNWGCTSINPNSSSCRHPARPRTTMTCTPMIHSVAPNDAQLEPEYANYSNAFKGREYTDAIIKQHGTKAQAAKLAVDYIGPASSSHLFFGKGKWYLPSAGEMLYLSGVDFSNMSSITASSGITGINYDYVEESLKQVSTSDNGGYGTTGSLSKYIGMDTKCSTIEQTTPRLWTSSEVNANEAYYWDSADKKIKIANKQNPEEDIYVRPVIMLRDPIFVGETPQIGSLVSLALESVNFPISYTGNPLVSPWRTYNAYSGDYPVGVVYYISPDKRIVRIISCREASASPVKWLSSGTPVDIQAIPNNAWDNIPEGTPLEMSVLFDGRGNTRKLIEFAHRQGIPVFDDEISEDEIFGTLVDAYYFYAPGVTANDSNFGQGKWYIPAIGELMDLVGWDWNKLSDYVSSNTLYEITSSNNVAAGYTGTKLNLVNNALQTLADKGVTASPVNDVQSSNPGGEGDFYIITGSEGLVTLMGGSLTVEDTGSYDYQKHQYINEAETIARNTKHSPNRLSAILENRFRDKAVKPAIGDVMYADLSYGSAADYDGSKTPVGIVYWVSEDGGSARIINLSGIVCKFNDTENSDIWITDFEHPYSGTCRKTGYEMIPQYDNSISLAGSITYNNEEEIFDLREQINIPTDGEISDLGDGNYFYTWNHWSKAVADGNLGTSSVSNDVCLLDSENIENEPEDEEDDDGGDQEPLTYGPLHNGKAYTRAIVDQLGEDAQAAYAATRFYAPRVAANDENFGQGKWYLPAIGELMDMYGYDVEGFLQHIKNVNEFNDFNSGFATGENVTKVNQTLQSLAAQGVEVSQINHSYHSSSEYYAPNVLYIDVTNNNAGVGYTDKMETYGVRLSLALENKFNNNVDKPQIGDVMYSDLSYGSANEYDSSKIAIGVVYWVSSDGGSAKIVNLKDLQFSYVIDEETGDYIYDNYTGNYLQTFDPDNPYSGDIDASEWSIGEHAWDDITAIPNIFNNGTINNEVMTWNSGSN